ncbi:hypothetical protein NDU88_002609 [Pleurodeles waltl]|uniref:Uncharacterized protein n=1 Tax=Pleurodeles waltl TaxID=8319 RepID=A0AAV7M132_PLEWA|nr:hypothetical protein NDU88_002609 [Pleurodeles waltl]
MSAEAKVQEALALLKQASRMDLIREEALAPRRPSRRASAGVAAAVAACSPPRAASGVQVGGVSRGAAGLVWIGAVWAGNGRAGRRDREFRGLPSGRGALRLRMGAEEQRTALGKVRWGRRAARGPRRTKQVVRARRPAPLR